MSKDLFTDLTAEQQEVVAGGLDIDFDSLANSTSFEDVTDAKEKNFDFGILSESGPSGTKNGFNTKASFESLFKKIFTDGGTSITGDD